MAAVVTEDWSRRTYVSGESASRAFLVTGVLDEREAEASIPVAEGASHPLDATLQAGTPQVRQVAPGAFEVQVDYAPFAAEFSGPGGAPGADHSMRFQWDFGEISEEIEIDAEGHPILNSAGDPFDPPLVRTRAVVYLTVTRWEYQFEVEKALAFIDHQNSDAITVQGQGILQPGRMRCLSYRPTIPLRRDQKSFPVEYRFELRPDGFDFRVLDAGYNGWSTATSPGKLKMPSGKDVASPVRLNGKGQPMDSTYKVSTATNGTTTPVSPSQDFVAGVAKEFTPYATFLRFRKLPWAPFRGLNIFA